MMMNDLIGERTKVFIRQRKEWTEILVDWETKNQYDVLDEQGQPLGTLAEKAGGWATLLRRGIFRSHRAFEVYAFDRNGRPALQLRRPFFFLFSNLEVNQPDGQLVGRVKRRFGLLYRRYDLLDATGHCFARIAGPLWRIWTFRVEASDGGRRATIAKKWSGGLGEIFTDTDTFLINLEHPLWRPDERGVIFSAAISIDFDFFENNQGSRGILRWRD
jgi:uncharacterized protein YxjI